jgi:osmotically-inducible protein OsmY
MKTDTQLQRDILDEIRWNPRVTEREIGVAVKDGVVTLTGSVPSFGERYAAETVVEGITGVKALANELTVKLPGSSVRSDTDIAHQVVDTLKWDVNVPNEKLKARVSDGWVTLEGEVDWGFQKEAAFRAVRYLTGVRGVTNAIRVAPAFASSFEVTEKIKAALRRRAEQQADRIQVSTRDHVVTLSGAVPSFGERKAAEAAAWSAPGVTEVKDDLIVTP